MRYPVWCLGALLAGAFSSAHATEDTFDGQVFLPPESVAMHTAPQAEVEVTPVMPPTELVGLKLDFEMRSVKYAVFFTPGSAKIGPKARRTLVMMVPTARSADHIVITGRSDPTGNARANAALSLARAQAVAGALRSAGVSIPRYELMVDASPSSATLASDLNTLWRPAAPLALMRRVELDVQSPLADEAQAEPLILRTSSVQIP